MLCGNSGARLSRPVRRSPLQLEGPRRENYAKRSAVDASPSSVLELAITPAWRSEAPIIPVVVGAFGAQTVIAGLFAALSRFSPTTFLAYGVALLSFFVFDCWFFFVEPMLTWIGLLDALDNAVMLVL